MYKGEMYSASFDHNPTQKEALEAITKELNNIKSRDEAMTFRRAAESYADMKRNVLSPRTIKEYSETAKRLPEWFCVLPVSDIEQMRAVKGQISQDCP